jgi:hypothetical protein
MDCRHYFPGSDVCAVMELLREGRVDGSDSGRFIFDEEGRNGDRSPSRQRSHSDL